MSHNLSDSLAIHATSFSSPNWTRRRTLALQALHPHLPAGLPLYRRLQCGRFTPASTILTNLRDDDQGIGTGDSDGITAPNGRGSSLHSNATSSPWLVVFLDRACRPETEAWTFGSWEATTTSGPSGEAEAETMLMRNFARVVRDLGIPEPAQTPKIGSTAPGRLDAEILFGAMHEWTYQALQRAGLAAAATGQDHAFPFTLYVFDLKASSVKGEDKMGTALPAGLRWGHLQDSHLELALSRQQYPRAKSTFAVLPNVAIFSSESKQPIAWAFVGLDGSLTALHVEEDWRKKGLAGLLTRRVFLHEMGMFWDQDSSTTLPEFRAANAFVAKGNVASERLCLSVGGQARWNVYWVRTTLQETAVV